jgi:hypothetical protein
VAGKISISHHFGKMWAKKKEKEGVNTLGRMQKNWRYYNFHGGGGIAFVRKKSGSAL